MPSILECISDKLNHNHLKIKNFSIMKLLFTSTNLTNYFTLLFSFVLFLIPPSVFGQISGTVFTDYNASGTRTTSNPNEPLVSGVIVTAYNSAGTVLASYTTTSVSTPNYNIPASGSAYNGTLGSNTGSVASGTAVRLVFTIPISGSCASANAFSAYNGASYGSSVQFINGGSTNVNFAINHAEDYNVTSNPTVFVPCYVAGDPLATGPFTNAGDMDWFVGYAYNSSGTSEPTRKVNGRTIGPTWGVAYSKQAQKIFTSAFIKRHVGLGVLGSGGIYLLTPTTTSFTVTQFYDMDANGYRTRAGSSAPAYGNSSSYTVSGASDNIVTFNGTVDAESGFASGLGVVGTNADRGLTSNPDNDTFDPAAFDQVGKVGIGGLEISDDGKFLFVMNLYSRKVYRLELNDAFNPTSVISVSSYSIPSVSVTNGHVRPFALSYHHGKLYVGAVASGENGGTTADLRAFVFELNNPKGAAAFTSTPILNISLNYTRGYAHNIHPTSTKWLPWTNNSNASFDGTEDVYPCPMLTDIDFTDRGDMILDFTDRGGHQWGNNNYKTFGGFIPPSTSFVADGDILVAGYNCNTGTFAIENAGTYNSDGVTYTGTQGANGQGPGGGEFFGEDSYLTTHQETSQGALAILRGYNQGIFTEIDPISLFTGGTSVFSTTNGAQSSGYQLYGSFDGFSKANGLGDLELSGTTPPLEIGNRVWSDTNRNGVQDAGENGIANVSVELYADFDNNGVPDGAVLASTTTSAIGTYYFNASNVTDGDPSVASNQAGPQPNKRYLIRIGSGDWSGTNGINDLVNLSLTTTNVTGAADIDLMDNDAALSSSIPTIAYTTGNFGENNHTLDFGFAAPCDTTLVVSNATICSGSSVNLFTLASGVKGNLTYSTNGTTWTTLSNPTNVTPSVTTTYFIKDTISNGCFDIDTLMVVIQQPITALTASPSVCNSTTNTYNLTVSVTFSTAPSGNINIKVGDITRTFTVSSSLNQTFTFTNLQSNSIQGIDITAALANQPSCIFTKTDAYNAPNKCTAACCASSVFTNTSFETGTWTGTNTFLPGVPSTFLPYNYANSVNVVMSPWEHNISEWVESINAVDGKRFVYLHEANPSNDNIACVGKEYPVNNMPINKCTKYKMCFDWASFNKDFPNGRAALSSPKIDIVYSNTTYTAASEPLATFELSTPTANQDWNNLTWQHVEYEFSLPYNISASTGYIAVLVSESLLNKNGILVDNVSLCEVSDVVTASVIAGNQTICSGGNPAAFTVTTPATGNGTLTYQWQSSTTDCSTGFTDISGATSATYDAPAGLTTTTYYRVIVTNTFVSATCNDTSNCVTVTVTPLPPSPSVSNQTVCTGATTTAVTFGGSATYSWTNNMPSIGLAASGTGNIPAFTATNTTSSAITATITVTPTANGCTGTAQTFTITVYPAITSTVSVTTGGTTVCTGASVSLTANVTNLTPDCTIQWQSGNGTTFTDISGATGTTYTATNLSSSIHYRVRINCTTNPCANFSVPLPITVNENPNASINGNNTVCSGGVTTLDAGSYTSYLWSTSATTQTITAGIGTYTVTVTDINGCKDTNAITVSNYPTPSTPSVPSPITNICPLTTVDLTTISSALTPSVSGGVFEWHVSNSSSSALVNNPTTVGLGSYYLFEKSPTNCYSVGNLVKVQIQTCCPTALCLPVIITRN